MWSEKLKKFFSESRRILLLARKPGKEEYMLIAKITGLGMIIIGIIGMVIRIGFEIIGLR